MSRREWMLAALLALAGACVVVGLADLSTAAAWIGGGLLSAVWAWFVLAEDAEAAE